MLSFCTRDAEPLEAVGDFPEWRISARQRSGDSVHLKKPVLNRVGVGRLALQDPTCQLRHTIVVLVGERRSLAARLGRPNLREP